MKTKLSNFNPSTKQWLFFAIFFGLPMGVGYSLQNGNWVIGMGCGLLAGVLYATGMLWIARWFSKRQIKRFATERPALDGESVLFEGPANHFKGAEGVGGYLWLTPGQLFFKSHRFNIQNHVCKLPLSEITGAEATKTFGLVPNGLLVRTVTGSAEKFVVHNQMEWVAAILDAQETRNARPR